MSEHERDEITAFDVLSDMLGAARADMVLRQLADAGFRIVNTKKFLDACHRMAVAREREKRRKGAA
jgi:hypothetical protein